MGAGDGSHPTKPIRAKNAVAKLVERLKGSIVVHDPALDADIEADKIELAKVHGEAHIHGAVNNYVDSLWGGPSESMSRAGLAMFRGTVRAVRALLAGKARVAFNPQGAKHHAMRDTSSGFCLFNDMAWAAQEFKAAGLKPLYLDWDIHAGDGVYELLRETDIPTLSIHNGSIFPGNPNMQDRERRFERHEMHQLDEHAYNWNVLDEVDSAMHMFATAPKDNVCDCGCHGIHNIDDMPRHFSYWSMQIMPGGVHRLTNT